MSHEYGTFDQNSFPMETRVLVATDNWHNEQEQFPANNASLFETMNDSFMTVADSTRDNSAQFYSVLETTSETILNDMSHLTMDITPAQEEYIQQDETEIVNEIHDNQDVVLFRVDGSDELYGFQMAQDAEGNMQKYQFQVRQTEDGQFETVPGTIQLIPTNEEVILGNTVVEEVPMQPVIQEEVEHSEQIFIKTELEGFINEDLHQPVEDDEKVVNRPEEILQPDYNEELEQEDIEEELNDDIDAMHVEHDTKEGILEEKTKLLYNEQYLETDDTATEIENGAHDEYIQVPVTDVIHEDADHHQEDQNPEDMIVYFNQEHLDNSNKDGEEQYYQEEIDTNQVQVYIPDENAMSSYEDDINEQEDSDSNYIESIHITGEDEDYEEMMIEEPKKSVLTIESQLKHINPTALRIINRGPKTTNKISPYTLVIKNTEKENVENSLQLKTVKRVNPRSILKSSLAIVEEKVEPDVENKRFSKSKQAVQAKQFHNYISQTKILEAPVRQSRLPRKQKIEPLERLGEEIVVQEVVVSSNGFIETREDGVLTERKPLVPSECIQLSDSEDEARKINKKRKRREKERQKATIVISDSEDDDSSPTKKSRSSSNTDDYDDDDLQIVKKQENPCQQCNKLFPSELSLKTHMQYHSFEELNTSTLKTTNLKTSVLNTKYKCSECNECFKNNILLSRHIEMHKNKSSKIECTICRKLFSDRNQLALHKRGHIKDQLFKSTNTKLTSPKKLQPNKHKSPETKKPNKPEQFKCKDCNKRFSSALLLTSHSKMHKKFTCITCSKQFLSKILLDDHILKHCVKSPNIKNKKVSYVPLRKSTFISPKRTTRHTTAFNKPTEMNWSTPFKFDISCDSCDKTFPSHTELFKHKVVAHGLNTPDKSIGKEVAKKTLYKPLVNYCGVPATSSLNKAFSGLRRNLPSCNKDK